MLPTGKRSWYIRFVLENISIQEGPDFWSAMKETMEVTVYSQGMPLRISFHLPTLSVAILQYPVVLRFIFPGLRCGVDRRTVH